MFNQFFIRLDRKPASWEHRLNLFVGHLVDSNHQSSTVKSYVSAIKAVLLENKIKVDIDQTLISSIMRACRLINDQIRTRLPIQRPMLGVLLKQIDIHFDLRNQPYLKTLFKTIYSTMYFGLFRIGELTHSQHVVLARDVHVAYNKRKFMFILRTSKTHYKNSKPQMIKITSTSSRNTNYLQRVRPSDIPCPYNLLREYLKIRGNYKHQNEQFFVFSDNSPVMPSHVRACLKTIILQTGFKHQHLYSVHALRAGRACDLLKLGVSVESIKKVGRWKSNAVYKYLK